MMNKIADMRQGLDVFPFSSIDYFIPDHTIMSYVAADKAESELAASIKKRQVLMKRHPSKSTFEVRRLISTL